MTSSTFVSSCLHGRIFKCTSLRIINSSFLAKRNHSGNETVPDRSPKAVLPKLKLPSQDFTVKNLTKFSRNDSTNQKQSGSAWSFAKKLRSSVIKEKEKHIFHGQFKIPDFSKYESEHFAKYLRRYVLYANKNLVVINKPYGVPCHDGDGINMDIKKVLPLLSKMIYGINTNLNLQLCHRVDKFTTGILICSPDSDISKHIAQLFREQQVLKKYWAVVLGNPSIPKGVIDIPLKETLIKANERTRQHARIVSSPDVWYDETLGKTVPLKTKRGHYAITHYSVLDTGRGLSLVELQPKTTTKHQLRVHTAEGLSCPILGDHKYSSSNQLVPQRLPPKVLKHFNLSATKTRNIPMHLHLRQVLIPNISGKIEKPNMCFQAKVGSHFAATLYKFRLRPSPAYKQNEWNAFENSSEEKVAAPKDPDNELYFDPTLNKH